MEKAGFSKALLSVVSIMNLNLLSLPGYFASGFKA